MATLNNFLIDQCKPPYTCSAEVVVSINKTHLISYHTLDVPNIVFQYHLLIIKIMLKYVVAFQHLIKNLYHEDIVFSFSFNNSLYDSNIYQLFLYYHMPQNLLMIIVLYNHI